MMYDWTRSASETNEGITMDLLGFWSRIGKVHEFPIEHTGSVVPVHLCCTPRKGGNLFAQASRQVDGFRTRRSLNFKLPGAQRYHGQFQGPHPIARGSVCLPDSAKAYKKLDSESPRRQCTAEICEVLPSLT